MCYQLLLKHDNFGFINFTANKILQLIKLIIYGQKIALFDQVPNFKNSLRAKLRHLRGHFGSSKTNKRTQHQVSKKLLSQ